MCKHNHNANSDKQRIIQKAINKSRKVLSYNYNNHNTVYYQSLLKVRLGVNSKLGEI